MKKAEQSTETRGGAPTILYVDFSPQSGIDRRRLDGLRRYAATRKWRVETLEHRDCSPAALREAIARFHPIGCAAECWCRETGLRPSLFGNVPVVYFSPPNRPGWRYACGVSCDEAAVARMAFEELSSTNPPSYAVVSFTPKRRWARERVEAFHECCRKAGVDCVVSRFPLKSADGFPDCVRSMVPWVSSLPQRCAIFAVNDLCAIATAEALAAAGRSFPRTVTLVGADGDDPPAWDRETAETISSVRLDHEQAGYLAAKALGTFAANEGLRSAQNDESRKREMEGTACAANEGRRYARNEKADSQFAPEAHPPFGGNATLHCGVAAPPLPPSAAPPFVFPPLLVERRKSTRGYGRREPRILEAMDMIRREACSGLTAKQLAGRFRGTRQLFDLRFREAMGHSPLDEIIHVRLERTLELLARPDFPISAIASFCGFPSERVLQKHFQSRFHMSMRDWRKARR